MWQSRVRSGERCEFIFYYSFVFFFVWMESDSSLWNVNCDKKKKKVENWVFTSRFYNVKLIPPFKLISLNDLKCRLFKHFDFFVELKMCWMNTRKARKWIKMREKLLLEVSNQGDDDQKWEKNSCTIENWIENWKRIQKNSIFRHFIFSFTSSYHHLSYHMRRRFVTKLEMKVEWISKKKFTREKAPLYSWNRYPLMNWTNIMWLYKWLKFYF